MSEKEIIEPVAKYYSGLPDVEAVSLAGSTASGKSDEQSDLDLYIYSHNTIPLSARTEIAKDRADRYEIGNTLWEPFDAWLDRDSGKAVEVVFRTTESVEKNLDQLFRQHQASLGYSTGICHSIIASSILFDRQGWYTSTQKLAGQPYPKELQRAIVIQNRLAMRGLLVAPYVHQIELAILRNDLVSINHRLAALLASYFDIIFAVNRMPHPGEKRQTRFAIEHCTLIPEQMEKDLEKVLRPRSDFSDLVSDINAMLDRLDVLLTREQLL